MSSDTGQSGLEFNIDSTSVRRVASTSSSTRLALIMTLRAVRTLRMSLSQALLACDAFGGWNFYWHPLWESSLWMCSSFQLAMACLISLEFSAPTKLVPLSEYINFGGPRRFINLLRTFMKSSDSREVANSRWTALEFKQLNKAPRRLTTSRPFLTLRGPK